MSSANLVEVIGIPETAYGQTPALAGADGVTFRFTSETLSGTPTTVESAELRTDRMSGGQVVVGLESGGELAIELAPDPTYDLLYAMGMMSDWIAGASGTDAAPMAIMTNPQIATLTFATLDLDDIDGAGRPLLVGDVMTIGGFTNPLNNGVRQVVAITGGNIVSLAVPKGATAEASPAGGVQWSVPDYLDIGALQQSLSLSKAYKEVTHLATTDEHSQRYPGALVSAFNVDIEYGAIIKGSFTFLANGYVQEAPSLHQATEAAGGTIAEPGTSNPLNASVDMGLVTVNDQPTDYCIEKLTITLDNGLTPQNCIGRIAPSKYA